ncbi:SDR family NAD(P)-dependent oxidoreductase [Rhizorhabdus argentea]|uniref:SDR family NAD(P)-dependent oxidoreductase n=1 Tax=Rhizorhabdus argentea TaxID=1387174 RepID=UPI0030ED8F49
MTRSLERKTALVTGASGGIGRAIAQRLAGAGATVAVHFNSGEDRARETVDLIEQAGGEAFTLQADLMSVASIESLFDELDSRFTDRGHSGLDILVNNAGKGNGASIAKVDEALFDLIVASNMKSSFFVTKAALPRIPAGGRIISISSMVSVAATPQGIVYSLAKAAVNAFTRSLAAELGPRRISVNAIAPGATDTALMEPIMADPAMASWIEQMTAMGRIAHPDEIAAVALFLASPEGGWITGQTVQASGGMHL